MSNSNLNNAQTLQNEDLSVMRLFENIKRNFNKINEGSKIHPDCSIYMPDYEVETPFFTYKIDERTTSEQTGHKPRFSKKDYDNRIRYLGMLYQALIEFGVYGKSYSRVNKEREWFEEFMQRQKQNIKESIVKFFFIEQDKDEVVEVNEDSYIKQTITYYLVHQRVYAIPFNLIEEEYESIVTELGQPDPYSDFMPKQ